MHSSSRNDKPHLLSVYTDANFGSQLGNSVPDGSEIEMFKFRSMSGFLIMRCGGPIAWKAVRQERSTKLPKKFFLFATFVSASSVWVSASCVAGLVL